MDKLTVALAIFTALLSCNVSVHGSGFIMHMEASNRAIQFFSRTFHGLDVRTLVLKHQDAFQTGAIYPDSFYSPKCTKFESFSPSTHKLDFIKFGLDYLLKEYQLDQPETILNTTGEKLLVFLLGNVAHQIQDDSWHGYNIDQGFVNTLAQVNFHRDFDAAHNAADFGGDSVSMYEFNFINLYLGISQWYIPVNDLYNIYVDYLCKRDPPLCPQVMGLKVGISLCTGLTMGRAMLHKMLIHRWYTSYAADAPLLTSPRFTDYFLGGMNDLAWWTTQRLETALRYLEDKDSCMTTSSNESAIFWMCGDQPKVKPPPYEWMPPVTQHETVLEYKKKYMAELFRMTDSLLDSENGDSFGSSDEDLIEEIRDSTGSGVYIRPKGALRQTINKNAIKDLFELSKTERTGQEREDEFAPPEDDFYKYYVKKSYSLIGQALVSADFDQNGVDDLVVGVPGYSEDNRLDEGRVYVVKSTEEGLPSEDVDLESAAQTIEPPFTGPGRFGYSIVTLDINDDSIPDIVISAPLRSDDIVDKPYSGAIYFYYGQASGTFKSTPDVTVNCNMRYCNFGTALSTGDVNHDGKPDLIVGSPYASQSFKTNRQNGFVAVFYARRIKRQPVYDTYHAADLVVWGVSQYSWFGYAAITTTNCDLLVGAPGQKTSNSDNQWETTVQMSGAVYCYTAAKQTLQTVVSGTKEFEFFGAALAEGYPQGKMAGPVLAIGAPNSDNRGRFRRLPYQLTQSGTVYLYNSKNIKLIEELQGDRKFAAFGRVLKFADVDGDNFEDLIVGSPLRSPSITNLFYGPAKGELYLYYGKADFPMTALARPCLDSVTPCPGDQADGVFGTRMWRAQAGSNFAFLAGAPNTTQLIVANQRTEDYGHQSGRLLLFNNCLNIV